MFWFDVLQQYCLFLRNGVITGTGSRLSREFKLFFFCLVILTYVFKGTHYFGSPNTCILRQPIMTTQGGRKNLKRTSVTHGVVEADSHDAISHILGPGQTRWGSQGAKVSRALSQLRCLGKYVGGLGKLWRGPGKI